MSMSKKKIHILEPGSWSQTLCGRDRTPGDLAFKTTERDLDALYETEVCIKCMNANRKQLSVLGGGK